jgi:adenylate cyclase
VSEERTADATTLDAEVRGERRRGVGERILVVDDTPANIQMAAATLKEDGYTVSVATSGQQALEAMARARPDLVLLDIVMPGMDGFETCAEIKARPEWSEIPIIFLTGRAETSDIVRGFELGAVDYVAKPFNAHELLARVNTHLTMDQLRRSLSAKNAELGQAHELLRKVFGRYVSEQVAEKLLRSPQALELGGEEREVTILMSDLRGFTAMAERMAPQEVIGCVNLYLEAMLEVIWKYHGTINEIIGDAILVIFGAPIAVPDHAATALACALSMELEMKHVNERLAERGGPRLEMGVAVHTGRVVVGNIGSMRRTKYAAVGSNVNLTGRIESYTTGGQILISEDTRKQITAPLRIDREFMIEPKGSALKLHLYDVGGVGAPYDVSLPQRKAELLPLAVPIPIRFNLIEDKIHADDVYEGNLTRVSDQQASFESELPVEPLSNVRIVVPVTQANNPAGEILAKVLESSGDAHPSRTRVRFTSVTPELGSWLGRAV